MFCKAWGRQQEERQAKSSFVELSFLWKEKDGKHRTCGYPGASDPGLILPVWWGQWTSAGDTGG